MTAANVSRMPSKPRAKKAPASVAAREAEAGDGYVVVEQCGVTVKIPVGGKVPVAAIDAFRDGDKYEGTKQLIGAEQWKALKDAGMTRDDLVELDRKYTEALGN